MKQVKNITAFLLVAAVSAAYADITVRVDGSKVYFNDVEPMIMNSRVMVPLRGVFEKMGATVYWNPRTKVITADKGDIFIELEPGQQYASVDNENIWLDSPPTIIEGRAMVPLRFVSESLGASVEWIDSTQTVEIKTNKMAYNDPMSGTMMTIDKGTVIPFELITPLSSNNSYKGQLFSARLDTMQNSDYYAGLPEGTIVEGHVGTIRPKDDEMPGILGLEFDRVKLPNGLVYPINGSLISLDEKNVSHESGRLVAKDSAKDDVKYVGYGAGAGALVALATDNNLLTGAAIGAALGFLYDELKANPSKSNDVKLKEGTRFGVVLDSNLTFRSASVPKS